MRKIEADFGFIISLGEIDEVSTTILEVLPGRKITKEFHKKTREVEIILRGKIFANGVEKKTGDILVWEPGKQHEYSNKSSNPVRILCIAMPKYDPSDTYKVDT